MAQFKTISLDHGCRALTLYLHSLSMINKDTEVVGITKAPGSLDLKLKIEKEKND